MSTPQTTVSPAGLFALDEGEVSASDELSIRRVVPVASIDEDDLLALAAQARWPEHAPIARALAAAVKERVISSSRRTPESLQAGRWELVPGRGVTGRVGGFELLIGTPRLIEDAGIVIAESARRVLAEHARRGWTSVLVGACRGGPAPRERHRSLLGILALGRKADASTPTCPAATPAALRAANTRRTWMKMSWVTTVWHWMSSICTNDRARRCRRVALLICAAGLAGTLLSLRAVAPDEVAIVQRLGRVVAYCGPGLHVRPLWTMETIIRVRPQRVRTAQIGLPIGPTSLPGQGTDLPIGELVLTGDVYAPTGPQTQPAASSFPPGTPESASQLLRLDARVQYVISDLHDFVFGCRDPNALVAISAESVLRDLIGGQSMMASLGPQRGALATRGKQLLQNRLDALGCGVSVRAIVLNDLEPAPGTAALDVADAFNQVTRADARRAEAITQAQAECDRLVDQARLRAEKIRGAARVAQDREIEAARERSEWVRAHHAAFRQAPDRVRRQMLIDLIAESTSGRAVILDPTLNDTVRLLLETGEPDRPLSPEALEKRGSAEPTAPKGGGP